MTGTVLLIVQVPLWLAAFFALRAYVKKRSAGDALLAGLTAEVRNLEAEFNRIADRNISFIEERAAALRELLETADAKTALFKEAAAEMAARQEALRAEQEKTALLKKELEEARRVYGEKPLSLKIGDLQEKGFSIDQIARKLEKTVTEIELALAVQD